jgi:hypothetical protein
MFGVVCDLSTATTALASAITQPQRYASEGA